MPITDVLSGVATVLNVAAGVFLGWPALRFSNHLLAARRLKNQPAPESSSLAELKQWVEGQVDKTLSEWDRRDHWMLQIGFAAFLLGAVIELAVLGLEVSGYFASEPAPAASVTDDLVHLMTPLSCEAV